MDERQREDQRLGNAGDADAMTRALAARIRRGERERVELLAYLGLSPAAAVLDSPPPIPADLGDWVLGLERWGKQPCVRAARAAVELLREECLRKQPRDADVGSLLDLIDRWLEQPGLALANEIQSATLELQRAVQGRLFLSGALHAVVLAGKTSWMAGIYAKQAALCAKRVVRHRNEPAVRAAMSEALQRWAL